VDERYRWDVVIERYERFLASVASRRPTRFATVSRSLASGAPAGTAGVPLP
jgi:hypothetical protein